MPWTPLFVMPNLQARESLGGRTIALAPWDDPRVMEVAQQHAHFRQFLDKFTDAFGKRIQPAVLLMKRSGSLKKQFSGEQIASFRDLVAISVIPYSRANGLIHPSGGHRIQYSNTFWFYPWSLDKNYEHLVQHTLAQLSLHEVRKFQGQSTPEMWPSNLHSRDVDEVLFRELIERWYHRYRRPNVTWQDRALFRSLNMAYHASQLPAGPEVTLLDIGRTISLWVSAFEILAHPGLGKSGLFPVYELLERVSWLSRASKKRLYRPYGTRKSGKTFPIACWLYGELHSARNDFLHGNPVSSSRLKIKESKRSLSQYAAPLYRLALTSFLNLRYDAVIPPLEDVNAFAKHLSESTRFERYQGICEQAILTARTRSVADDG